MLSKFFLPFSSEIEMESFLKIFQFVEKNKDFSNNSVYEERRIENKISIEKVNILLNTFNWTFFFYNLKNFVIAGPNNVGNLFGKQIYVVPIANFAGTYVKNLKLR